MAKKTLYVQITELYQTLELRKTPLSAVELIHLQTLVQTSAEVLTKHEKSKIYSLSITARN